MHETDIEYRRIPPEDILLFVYALRTKFRKCEVLFYLSADRCCSVRITRESPTAYQKCFAARNDDAAPRSRR
jgi:hypothetical protein